MIHLSKKATNDEILEVVKIWIELLALEKYEEAYEMFLHRKDSNWSPKLIKEVISNYGFIEPHESGEIFKVTSIIKSIVGKCIWKITWYENNLKRPIEHLGLVTISLPLNGEWSDVTASFEIVDNKDNLVLELDDIHVW